MVDGADKVNGCGNSPYINQSNATSEVKSTPEVIQLVQNKNVNNKFPFAIEKEKDIEFEMPENAPPGARDFTNALIENKEKLMQVLNIDSETYNMLAQTAVCIAMKKPNSVQITNLRTFLKKLQERFIKKEIILWV